MLLCVHLYTHLIHVIMYIYTRLRVGAWMFWAADRRRPCRRPGCLPCLRRSWAVHSMRSNSNTHNAIPSQSFSFKRKCHITSARESLSEPLGSSRFYYALMRIKASIKEHRDAAGTGTHEQHYSLVYQVILCYNM